MKHRHLLHLIFSYTKYVPINADEWTFWYLGGFKGKEVIWPENHLIVHISDSYFNKYYPVIRVLVGDHDDFMMAWQSPCLTDDEMHRHWLDYAIDLYNKIDMNITQADLIQLGLEIE